LIIMKRLNQALVIASLVVLPLASHAADTKPVTRAEVRAEQFAAARTGGSVDTSYGPSVNGIVDSGSHVVRIANGADAQPNLGNLYRHH
jgi:hypothetical protein